MKMMLRGIAFTLATLVSLAAGPVNGAGMSPDPTGIWYDPDQPGWGMSVTQQGDTIFVVLFVYDANHNPQWYVASNVVDTGTFVNTIVGEAFAGPLYRTTGPAFALSTDTTMLGVTAVGTIQIAYVQPIENLSVTYTVDGTTVAKTVQPQTWRSNSSLLTGDYSGGIFINSIATCQAPAPFQQASNFSVAPGSSPDSVSITWGTGLDTECVMSGTYAQRGQFGTLTGPVMCGPIPNPVANVGTLAISQMTIGPSGFSGSLSYSSPTSSSGSNCGVGGTIGGVKHASSTGASIPAP
jgi:hypothetical protein